ncbi:hypothetical protein B0H10DRAFT_1992749 [Mycena sp. CBHHK59/15]|nr:hypothetical protein B0H10DRAFT_1992749 [Mycena sp. CBHHK59/15]
MEFRCLYRIFWSAAKPMYNRPTAAPLAVYPTSLETLPQTLCVSRDPSKISSSMPLWPLQLYAMYRNLCPHPSFAQLPLSASLYSKPFKCVPISHCFVLFHTYSYSSTLRIDYDNK